MGQSKEKGGYVPTARRVSTPEKEILEHIIQYGGPLPLYWQNTPVLRPAYGACSLHSFSIVLVCSNKEDYDYSKAVLKVFEGSCLPDHQI